MADLDQTLALYAGAWSTVDPAERAALLADCWAEDGVYADPRMQVRGRAALDGYIGAVQARMPGARIVLTGPAEAHHGRLHFTWALVLADGSVVSSGRDFGRLAPDGRLAEIVGFFDPPPAVPGG